MSAPTAPGSRPAATAALVAATVLFVYPLVWLLSASLKPRGDVLDNRILPRELTCENYLTVWQEAPLALWLLNTLVVTALASPTVTFSSATVAWGYARHRFRGRCALFTPVPATMMLPAP